MMGLFTKIVNGWKLVIIFAKKFHQKFDRIINKHDSGFYFSIKILQMTLRTNCLKSFFSILENVMNDLHTIANWLAENRKSTGTRFCVV